MLELVFAPVKLCFNQVYILDFQTNIFQSITSNLHVESFVLSWTKNIGGDPLPCATGIENF